MQVDYDTKHILHNGINEFPYLHGSLVGFAGPISSHSESHQDPFIFSNRSVEPAIIFSSRSDVGVSSVDKRPIIFSSFLRQDGI